jgi:hypothetical protein
MTHFKNDHFFRLTVAWLALVVLTLASLGLSEWFRAAQWLPLLVAAIIWIKGALVARCFIESHVAHPFIARVLTVFIAVSPLALIATAFFGGTLARWATL